MFPLPSLETTLFRGTHHAVPVRVTFMSFLSTPVALRRAGLVHHPIGWPMFLPLYSLLLHLGPFRTSIALIIVRVLLRRVSTILMSPFRTLPAGDPCIRSLCLLIFLICTRYSDCHFPHVIWGVFCDVLLSRSFSFLNVWYIPVSLPQDLSESTCLTKFQAAVVYTCFLYGKSVNTFVWLWRLDARGRVACGIDEISLRNTSVFQSRWRHVERLGCFHVYNSLANYIFWGFLYVFCRINLVTHFSRIQSNHSGNL